MMRYIIAFILSGVVHIAVLSVFPNNGYKRETEIESKIFDVELLWERTNKNPEPSAVDSSAPAPKVHKKAKTKRVSNNSATRKCSTNGSTTSYPKNTDIIQADSKDHLAAENNRESDGIDKDLPVEKRRLQGVPDMISNISSNNNNNESYTLDTTDILEEIYRRLSRSAKRSYPYKAKRLGIEGKVVVSFRVSQNGKAENIRIKRPSGEEILDSAAIKIVENGSPYPVINEEIDVPIIFSLMKDN